MIYAVSFGFCDGVVKENGDYQKGLFGSVDFLGGFDGEGFLVRT